MSSSFWFYYWSSSLSSFSSVLSFYVCIKCNRNFFLIYARHPYSINMSLQDPFSCIFPVTVCVSSMCYYIILPSSLLIQNECESAQKSIQTKCNLIHFWISNGIPLIHSGYLCLNRQGMVAEEGGGVVVELPVSLALERKVGLDCCSQSARLTRQSNSSGKTCRDTSHHS